MLKTEMEENRRFVASNLIPYEAPWLELAAAGFRIGEWVDPVLVEAEIPEGWTRQIDNHYWSYLVDPEGRLQFSCFYKNTEHDRKAFCRAVPQPETAA